MIRSGGKNFGTNFRGQQLLKNENNENLCSRTSSNGRLLSPIIINPLEKLQLSKYCDHESISKTAAKF